MSENRPRPLLVVFDLDDTLYPETEFVASGFRAVAQHLKGRFGMERDFLGMFEEVFRAGIRKRVFDVALRRMGLPHEEELIAELVNLYRTHHPVIRLFPGAKETLAALRAHFRLAMLTDGHPETQRNKVKALRLAGYFDRMLYTGDRGKDWSKPSRRGFEEIGRWFGASGACCAYVADNPAKDFYAPNRMGWLTVRVRNKVGLYRRVEASGQHKARREVQEIASVRPILEDWSSG